GTVLFPESVPLPGLAPSATVTLAVKPVTVFPWASCAVSWTAGVITEPAVALVGWTLKTSCVAAPAVAVNALLVAPVRPPAEPGRSRRSGGRVRRLDREGQVAGRAGGDSEHGAGRDREPGDARGQRVARSRAIDAQAREARHARDRRHRRRTGERTIPRVRSQRDGDLAREARIGVPEGVLGGHLNRRCDRRPSHGGA